MKIGVIGLGKLGFPFALVLARAGHEVIGYDADPSRMGLDILCGREQGLAKAIAQVRDDGLKLSFGPVERIAAECAVVFVCVQTPHDIGYGGETPMPLDRRDFDYTYLTKAVADYAAMPGPNDATLAVVSTVLPGTYGRDLKPIIDGAARRLKYAYVPQFIAMGTVLHDFEQSREPWLVGTDNIGGAEAVKAVFNSVSQRQIAVMSVASAEASKVLYNTWITAKITLANTAALVCDVFQGASAEAVTGFLKSCQERIVSTRYMSPGMGDGGACHPRDNIALSWAARAYDLPYDAFGFLIEAREKHAKALAERLRAIASDGMQHVILGTAFKPDSDLEAGSPALLTACYLPAPIMLDPIVPARAKQWNHELLKIKGPCAVLIACDHDDRQFHDLRWLPAGSSFLIPFMEQRTKRQFPRNALVEYFGRRE